MGWKKILPPCILILSVLVIGFWIADIRAKSAIEQVHKKMLKDSVSLSRSIDQNLVRELSFTPADLNSPAYQRLCKHFVEYTKISGFSGIFSFILRDGKLVFGPESYAVNSDLHSTPGDEYINPPEECFKVLAGAKPIVSQPYTDEFGTFITAFAPITDVKTGETIMGIGVDITALYSNDIYRQAYAMPITIMAILIIFISVSTFLVFHNFHKHKKGLRVRENLEVYLTAFAGIAITICLAIPAKEHDDYHRAGFFYNYAESNSSIIRNALINLKSDIYGIDAFFGGSDFVDKDEFAVFVSADINNSIAVSYKWAPSIEVSRKSGFENYMRSIGFDGYSIGQREGSQKFAQEQNFFYPIAYQEPFIASNKAFGFDLYSCDLIRQSLERAVETGLPVVLAKPDYFGFEPFKGDYWLVKPVYKTTEDNQRLHYGFVILEFYAKTLVESGSNITLAGGGYIGTGIIDISGDDAKFIASCNCEKHRDLVAAKWRPEDHLLSYVSPAFVFDRTLAIVSHCTPAFISANPPVLTIAVSVSGLIITAILTVLVGFLSSKRAALEALVEIRSAELKASRNDLAITLNSIGDAVIAADCDGNIMRMNPVAAKLTGWTANEALGRHIADVFNIINTKTRKPAIDIVKKVLKDGLVCQLANHTSLISKTGKECHIADSAAPIKDEDDNIVGVVLVFRDVSEQYKSDKQAEESRRRFRAIFDNSINAVALHKMVYDENGEPCDYIFLEANKAFEKHTGLKVADVIGKPVTAVNPGIEKSHIIKTYGKVVVTGKPIEFDFFSEPLNRHYSVNAYKTAENQFAAIFSDTTELKLAKEQEIEHNQRLQKYAEQMENLARQAQAATVAKGQFLANMSHEIRTPMNGVIGMLELLIDTPLNEKQKYYANIARSSGLATIDLINDILDFSKIEAGKVELNKEDFNLVEVVKQIVDMLSVDADKKGVKLSYTISDEVQTDIRADRRRLRQVLTNICGNSVKFTAAGSVDINITNAGDEGEKLLRFEVKDTGIGIPEDKIGLLFGAFQQIDDSNSREFGGTGLGLAISKRLVELLGGKIGVQSDYGKGTTFWFTIKYEEYIGKANDNKTTSTIETLGVKLTGCRVLVAEDNPVNQKVAIGMLERLGICADIAVDGKQAIDALSKSQYDLVLMDIQMGVMDGITATQLIRSSDNGDINPDIPIIAMTANAMEQDKHQCLKAGMNDYISKPFKPDTLVEVLHKWIFSNRQQEEEKCNDICEC